MNPAAISPPPPCIAYTGSEGNIFTLTPAHGRIQQLTWNWEKSPQPDEKSARLIHAWPAWGPDGSHLACFGLYEQQESPHARIYVVAADGVESSELAAVEGGMPIYGNWPPQGDRFAALLQRGERQLSLETVSLGQPGRVAPLLSGAPLFWSWSPRGDRLAAHVNNSQQTDPGARVVLIDAVSGTTLREVSTNPGEFRVPVWSPDEDLLAYVERSPDGTQTLLLYDIASGETGPVAVTSGTTAALWSADGQSLAFSSTTHLSSTLFSGVHVLDLSTGQVSTVLEERLLAFFWLPRGDALVYITVDSQQQHLRWHRLECRNGEKTELARFFPSREQMFIFSFFDQYAWSHPLVAPDGTALAFAGRLVGADDPEASSPTQIYLLPLDRPTAPRPVGPGQFVCWNLR